jgi:hypothetical protein
VRTLVHDCKRPGKPHDYYGEHVVYAVQEVLKKASKVPKTAAIVPEMSVVR